MAKRDWYQRYQLLLVSETSRDLVTYSDSHRRPTVFESVGVSGNNSLLTTGVYGIIKMVGAVVWLLYLIDTLGRRKLFYIGSIGGCLCM